MMGNKKLQVWLPLLFAVVLVIGMFFGYKLNRTGNSKGFFKVSQPTTLQEVIDLITARYVDTVNLSSIEDGAIKEVMNKLDPHSVYLPPRELKEANEDLAGNFDGIGVEFNLFSDTVNVTYVLPGGPSDVAGLQIGDKILSVNDSSLVKPENFSRIRELIRGPRGSAALLRVARGTDIITAIVKRGSIPIPSVDAAYMINKTMGYIKLNTFTANSYEEFMAALEDLQKKGLKELVYDLRGNNGGYMFEAIDMVDEFLSGDKLIVYTEGLNSKKREYRCKRPGLFEEGKLIILLDELSASASEVVAGALQDWDRATIIGRRSFGKGLVQEQYDLKGGSAIRLTVARYYTPVGRSIQRPYDKGKKVYMDEVWNRYSSGEAIYADSNKVQNGPVFTTPGGHTVFGGGGIMPDIFVPIDTATYPAKVNGLFVDGSFNRFVYTYYLKNRKLVDAYPSAAAYSIGFDKLESMWQEFIVYARQSAVDLGSLSAQQQQTIQRRLKAYLGRFRWRNNGYLEILNEGDKMLQVAINELKK